MSDYILKADLLTKSFPGPKRGEENVVFENVNFKLKPGEFVTCIGHSGCGKSTILNIMAGLDHPTSGYVFLKKETITGPGLDRAVVFQNHSLLPWLTTEKKRDFCGGVKMAELEQGTGQKACAQISGACRIDARS